MRWLRNSFYSQHASQFVNSQEQTSIDLQQFMIAGYEAVAVEYLMSAVLYAIPLFLLGASGFGGTPVASASTGGKAFGDAAKAGAHALKLLGEVFDRQSKFP